ncbi:hypothetical protein ACGF13_24070 [Kitasatospora sp. NPDC048286]
MEFVVHGDGGSVVSIDRASVVHVVVGTDRVLGGRTRGGRVS